MWGTDEDQWANDGGRCVYKSGRHRGLATDPATKMVTVKIDGDAFKCAGQNWVHRDILHVPSQPVQQFSAHSGLPLGHLLNQMPLNSLRQPSQLSPPFHQGIVGPTYGQSTQEVHQYVNVQPLQTSRTSVSMISFEGQRGQVLRASEGSVDAPADQNLQPTGRMRGSLTGVYSDALRQMIILPTEPVQAASQPVLNTPRPALAPHLQVLLARNGNVYGYLDGASGPM
ncbi:hypothetical protein Tco_0097174 [Tanacetum coccineum]